MHIRPLGQLWCSCNSRARVNMFIKYQIAYTKKKHTYIIALFLVKKNVIWSTLAHQTDELMLLIFLFPFFFSLDHEALQREQRARKNFWLVEDSTGPGPYVLNLNLNQILSSDWGPEKLDGHDHMQTEINHPFSLSPFMNFWKLLSLNSKINIYIYIFNGLKSGLRTAHRCPKFYTPLAVWCAPNNP